MWTKREDYKVVIKASWERCLQMNTPSSVVDRLKRCVADLLRWNKSVFGHVPKQIQNKRRALNDLVLRDRDGNLGSEINKLRKEINVLLDSEEIMWHQRAKVHWMNSGDRNTEYFHSKALDRRKKNTIY